MKKCPFCAENIQDEAIKCRHCYEFLTPGHSWGGRARAAGRGRPGPGTGKIFCGFALVVFVYLFVSAVLDPDLSKALRFLFSMEFLRMLKDILVPPKVISSIAFFYLLGFFLTILIRAIRLFRSDESWREPSAPRAEPSLRHFAKRVCVLGAGVAAAFAFFVLVLLAVFRHWDEAAAPFGNEAWRASVFSESGYARLKGQPDLLKSGTSDRPDLPGRGRSTF